MRSWTVANKVTSGCVVARPELRVVPAESSINTGRLLVTDARPVAARSAFKVQSSYFPGKGVSQEHSGLAGQKGCSPLLSSMLVDRNSVCGERNRIGGARKKRGSQKPRATLRREIHAAQEVLEARVGAHEVEFGSAGKGGFDEVSISPVVG